jgi:hypothetical protein
MMLAPNKGAPADQRREPAWRMPKREMLQTRHFSYWSILISAGSNLPELGTNDCVKSATNNINFERSQLRQVFIQAFKRATGR